MDIDKVIQNLREAKKKASCPPGFKYSKKMKSCVPIRKKGKYIGGRGYYEVDIVVEIIVPIVVKEMGTETVMVMVLEEMVTVVMEMVEMVEMVAATVVATVAVVMEEVEESDLL